MCQIKYEHAVLDMKLMLKQENICIRFAPSNEWIWMNFKGDMCVNHYLLSFKTSHPTKLDIFKYSWSAVARVSHLKFWESPVSWEKSYIFQSLGISHSKGLQLWDLKNQVSLGRKIGTIWRFSAFEVLWSVNFDNIHSKCAWVIFESNFFPSHKTLRPTWFFPKATYCWKLKWGK